VQQFVLGDHIAQRVRAPLIAPFLELYPAVQLDLRLTDNHNDTVMGGFELDMRSMPLRKPQLRMTAAI
jgi:DNA-binding transcriptional LysR family regulator